MEDLKDITGKCMARFGGYSEIAKMCDNEISPTTLSRVMTGKTNRMLESTKYKVRYLLLDLLSKPDAPKIEAPKPPTLKPIESVVVKKENGWVDARQVHDYLQPDTKFPMWGPRRIEQLQLEEGKDFKCHKSVTPSGQTQNDYDLSPFAAFQVIVAERNDVGREARRYLFEEQKAKAEAPSQFELYAELVKGMGIAIANGITTGITVALGPLRSDIDLVKVAVTPEAIDTKVKENIVARQVAGIPTSHISAADIARDYLPPIAHNVIGRMLKNAKHPRDEFEIVDARGDLHLTLVFRRDGLERAIEQVLGTVKFERATEQRYYFSSVLNGDSEFVVTRAALNDRRVAAIWMKGIPPDQRPMRSVK